MAIGGSIESVTIHGRTFPVPADSPGDPTLGGFENEFQANGDGITAREIKTRMMWRIEDLKVSIDIATDDLDYLQEIADTADAGSITITFADGTVMQGQGKPVGPIKYEAQTASADLALAGPGKLTRQ